jgi:hypothetical protein
MSQSWSYERTAAKSENRTDRPSPQVAAAVQHRPVPIFDRAPSGAADKPTARSANLPSFVPIAARPLPPSPPSANHRSLSPPPAVEVAAWPM